MGLNTINSVGICWRNWNCSESVQRSRPHFVFHLHPHEVKIGRGAVRLLGVGLNPQNDAGDLQFTPRHARREKGDILAVGAKRGVGECAVLRKRKLRDQFCATVARRRE